MSTPFSFYKNCRDLLFSLSNCYRDSW